MFRAAVISRVSGMACAAGAAGMIGAATAPVTASIIGMNLATLGMYHSIRSGKSASTLHAYTMATTAGAATSALWPALDVGTVSMAVGASVGAACGAYGAVEKKGKFGVMGKIVLPISIGAPMAWIGVVAGVGCGGGLFGPVNIWPSIAAVGFHSYLGTVGMPELDDESGEITDQRITDHAVGVYKSLGNRILGLVRDPVK